MEALEILTAVRELLSDPARWVQNTHAVDGHGKPCSARSERAAQWCLLGALNKCGTLPNGLMYDGYGKAAQRLFDATRGGIATYNDTHTHDEIMSLLHSVTYGH